MVEQLHQAALQVTENYFAEHAQELGDILADASATGYDEDALRRLAAESISYMLASRCGLQPEVPAFTGLAPLAGQPKAIEALGIAVSTGSEQVLRQIERTIRDTVRQHTERTGEHGTDLHAERRLPDSEPDGGGTDGNAGQVRTDAPALSGAAQADPVPDHAAERQADGASSGDRPGGERAAEQPDAETSEGSGRNGTAESNGSAGVGGPDEQLESTGGGADSNRTGVQLSLFPTEEAQRIIAESVPAAPFAFSYAQTDVDAVLCNVTPQMCIAAVVLLLHGKSAREVAAQLPDIYAGGLGLRLGNHDLSAWFDTSGIRLAAGHAARFVNTAQHLAWEDAAIRIQQLIEVGQYATNVELAEAPGWERAQVAQSLWYLYGDLQDAAQYFPLLVPLQEGGYPERTARLAQAFTDADYVQGVTANYLAFREALREKPELLRFRYHELDRLQQQLETLALPLQEFPSELTVLPSAAHFITEDEINHVMESGSMVAGGAERIRDFFAAHSSNKERATFLKDEYGTGGYAPALLGNWQSDEFHDSKGVVLKKDGCEDVRLSWEKVVSRIAALIERGRYAEAPKPEQPVAEETVQVQSTEAMEPTLAPDKPVTESAVVAQEPELQQPEPPQSLAENYHITNEALGVGSPKTKFAYNVAAIQLLKQIEAENRQATPEEQEILANYVGWGGIPQAFDRENADWAQEYVQLRTLLTSEEYAAARASTLNAHYTSPVVIQAMYGALEQMGFRNGNVLEPACGIGNFFGMLPESMQGSRLYGVELDNITGRIARQLYPNAHIDIKGFEQTDRRDFFDVAVGNVPFGNYSVADKAYDSQHFLIHDYFFAKALDQVRPGGVIAFITSKGTMDKANPVVRRYIAQRAELLGAVRLPNNAFKANAGTEVTADILFLQKRERLIDLVPDWVHLGQTVDGIPLNSYFAEHPEQVLGTMAWDSSMYGNERETTCNPLPGAELSAQLSIAMQHIHGTYLEAEALEAAQDTSEATIPADPDVKNYSFTLMDGQVYYRENSIMTRPDLSPTACDRVRGLIGLRDCVQELIRLQLADASDAEIQAQQSKLNELYDSFTGKYGLLNARPNAQAFATDSSYYLLCSLEIVNEQGTLERKADIFTKRTIRQQRTVEHVDTAVEALALSIGERADVDLPYMTHLTEKTREDLIQDLTGVIFPVPGTEPLRYVTADDYLSGNVRQKLKDAREAAAENGLFQPNVTALEAAQPKDLEASEIDLRLGATWLDKTYIQQFMFELLQPAVYLRRQINVQYSPYTSEWRISGKSVVSPQNVRAYMTFGTARANAYHILEDTLNLRDVRIYDTVLDAEGTERRVLNQKETTLAQQKQQAIKDAFQEWVWHDPVRRETLVAQYNELFNSTRPREYDGQHIRFGGMNPEITLREHQRNAVAHILYGGNTLLAHQVGAGKTFEMVAACMESKRLGLCQKAMFVVPNHLTEQWGSEFLRLYPAANILVTTKRDFEKSNRKKFCARIATGDYDAVIIGHSQFEKIPVSQERQERLLQEQIDEITQGIEELARNDGERFSIKQLERTRKQLESKLEKLQANERKDDVVTFEELGIDRLFVDEVQAYKNLFLYTKMRNVAGISTTEAQKSSDMFMKCRYMDELTGGRGIIFATGTPVSNSMTEMYTMQRYLQYDTLRQHNLLHFDAWASTFGETVTAIELAPEGTGYRARTRFAKFFNLPELMNMFKEVADIKTADQLHLPTPEAHYETVAVKPSEEQQEMMKALSERAALVHSGTVDPTKDNMLRITSDGRKLGLDQRLLNPLLPDFPDSKVNACVQNVLRIWKEGTADRLTQLVFCDLSTPKGKSSTAAQQPAVDNMDTDKFSVYDDIRAKLLAGGIPAKEIAFIHDADTEVKKKELFAKVRAGQVRVLLGSTAKMGAGTNVQTRLAASHDLDCPWRPGDLEQRAGRIVRQGNQNKDVHIYRYVTESSFDSYLWQTVENKQRFISQIMTSKSPVRSCDDVDEAALSYAEIKALCAGDKRIKEKMDLDIEVAKLRLLKADYQSRHYRLEDQLLKFFPQQVEQDTQVLTGLQKDQATAMENPVPEKHFVGMEIKGKDFADKEAAGEAILAACKLASSKDVELGHYRGFAMRLTYDSMANRMLMVLQGEMSHFVELGTDARGNILRMDNMLGGIPNRIEAVQAQLENMKQQMEAAKQELVKPFAQEAALKTKSARLAELDAELNMEKGVQQDEKDRQEQPLKARLAVSCPQQQHRERICTGMER